MEAGAAAAAELAAAKQAEIENTECERAAAERLAPKIATNIVGIRRALSALAALANGTMCRKSD